MRRRSAVILVALLLSGCGSIFSPDPIGIGRDRDELKQSPCACDEIPQNYGAWILPG
jgi:uncharacterized protein YceK